MIAFYIAFTVYMAVVLTYGLTRAYTPEPVEPIMTIQVRERLPSEIRTYKHELLVPLDIMEFYRNDQLMERLKAETAESVREAIMQSIPQEFFHVNYAMRQNPSPQDSGLYVSGKLRIMPPSKYSI
jgi:hypothetical protein